MTGGGLDVFDLDDDIKGNGRSDPGRQDDTRYGRPVELGRLFRALMRRRWLILVGAVVGMAAGVIIAKTIVPRVYVAETVMVWETDGEGDSPDIRELRTLVDSVKLPTNLALIRSGLTIEATLDQLAARLDVRFDRDSNLVIVRAEADSGTGAVELSQTAVNVFLAHQSAIAGERLQEDVDAREMDVERAREGLARAQEAYDAFRRERGVSDLSLEREQAIELTASLRAQAEIARADGHAAEARATTHTTSSRTGPSTHLRELRRRLETARSRLSEDHPRVQSLAAEVEAVEQTEAATAGSRSGSSSGSQAARNRAAARRRQETYERLEEDARTRLAELSAVEGEASALLASVRVAEGHVSDVEAEFARTRDEARGASPGFRVVADPIRPEEPERSYRKPTAVGFPIVFFILLLLVLLAIELRGLRVKTANELAYWGKAPVVGSTTWPNTSREFSAIVHEIAEAADRAGGRTLVVSASDLDHGIAKDVAEHLTVSASSSRERAAGSHEEGETKTFYDPQVDIITAAPGEKRAIGAGTGSAMVVAPTDTIVVDAQLEGEGDDELNPTRMPNRARREERTIARRRGRHLEQVRVSKAEVYLDDDEVQAPTEFLTQEGPKGDAYVRRKARAADRVLVIVRSGGLSVTRASELRALVGREDAGVGFLLIAVPDWLAVLADRAGPVSEFWRATQED